MFETLKAWIQLITKLGPTSSVSGQYEKITRFLVIQVMKKDGFFQCLTTPRTMQEIMKIKEYTNPAYLKEILDTFTSDNKKVLSYDSENQTYSLEKNFIFPDIQEITAVNDMDLIYKSAGVLRDLTDHITFKLRNKSFTFVEKIDFPGPHLFNYDESLSHRMYSALRDATFSFTPASFLEGEKMLNVGCGSGREIAELWVKTNGQKKITAVDPVPSFITMAKKGLKDNVAKFISRNKKYRNIQKISESNTPHFEVMHAEKLNFPDNSFDILYFQQILHWTSDPRKALMEMGRVLKPGGIILGNQVTYPVQTPYTHLAMRVHDKVHGFFHKKELLQWLNEAGITNIKMGTLANIFRGTKI